MLNICLSFLLLYYWKSCRHPALPMGHPHVGCSITVLPLGRGRLAWAQVLRNSRTFQFAPLFLQEAAENLGLLFWLSQHILSPSGPSSGAEPKSFLSGNTQPVPTAQPAGSARQTLAVWTARGRWRHVD